MGYQHYTGDCWEHHDVVRDFGGPRPDIVCLCGSTKFKEVFQRTSASLTKEGLIVLSPCVFGHVDMPETDWTTGGSALKIDLDELHRRMIDLADEVLVLNVGGYIGESTNAEIHYAQQVGRPVSYLEPPARDAEGTS
jgi:hypothetical protein